MVKLILRRLFDTFILYTKTTILQSLWFLLTYGTILGPINPLPGTHGRPFIILITQIVRVLLHLGSPYLFL